MATTNLSYRHQEGPNSYSEAPIEHRFSPYTSNGGTIVAVAGDDFAVVAGDTRLSEGYSILTRDSSKCFKMSDKCVLSSTGFFGDVTTLTRTIGTRMEMYKHRHGKTMSVPALAQMLSNTLYYRRFFPYYAYNVIGGIDENGKGCVFSYDPVGSYEREFYRAAGTGSTLLQPLLDNQLGYKNMQNKERETLTVEKVCTIIHDAMVGAADRDIYTGDYLEMHIITKDGVAIERIPLRKD